MPAQACRDVALKVGELAGSSPYDLLLDVGAGTGEIGLELAHSGEPYVGLDLSQPMLRVFQRRLEGVRANALLLVADANHPWPIADGSVRTIFGSRSFHLLSTEHVARETFRVAINRGALLLVGRVRRDPQSINARMRREMRHLLGESGGAGRDGEGRSKLLIQALVAQGATPFDSLVAARWTATHTPGDSLRSWKSKPGLAGTDISEPMKNEIFSKLERWAKESFDNLEKTFESNEEYVLEGVRIPAA